jgi:tetratricopeptide (TPR) repeat protein
MYLRTPKRYQRARRQRIISLRWLWLWLITPVVVIGGLWIHDQREQVAPVVRDVVDGLIAGAQEQVATITAPTPPPTADPGQTLAQADSAWRRGAIEDAMGLYAAALDGAPNDVTAHYRYALALIMEGRGDEALRAAERAVTANPFSSDSWAIRALALDRSDRPAEAVASARQALSINPNNARAYAFMAEAYLDANQIAQAREAIARALELNPDSVEALYVSGLIRRDADYDFRGAREEFQRAYELAPNLPYIAVELAWSEWYLQNYDRARSILLEVLDQNPQNLDALFATGYLFYQAYGDPNQSLDYLQRCITADPQNRACLRYMGTVQTGLGNTQAALQTYQALIAAGTDRPSDYLNAGRAYVNVGDCQSAVPLLQQGYELAIAAIDTNADTLARLERLLTDCQASFVPAFGAASAQPTVEPTGAP